MPTTTEATVHRTDDLRRIPFGALIHYTQDGTEHVGRFGPCTLCDPAMPSCHVVRDADRQVDITDPGSGDIRAGFTITGWSDAPTINVGDRVRLRRNYMGRTVGNGYPARNGLTRGAEFVVTHVDRSDPERVMIGHSHGGETHYLWAGSVEVTQAAPTPPRASWNVGDRMVVARAPMRGNPSRPHVHLRVGNEVTLRTTEPDTDGEVTVLFGPVNGRTTYVVPDCLDPVTQPTGRWSGGPRAVVAREPMRCSGSRASTNIVVGGTVDVTTSTPDGDGEVIVRPDGGTGSYYVLPDCLDDPPTVEPTVEPTAEGDGAHWTFTCPEDRNYPTRWYGTQLTAHRDPSTGGRVSHTSRLVSAPPSMDSGGWVVTESEISAYNIEPRFLGHRAWWVPTTSVPEPPTVAEEPVADDPAGVVMIEGQPTYLVTDDLATAPEGSGSSSSLPTSWRGGRVWVDEEVSGVYGGVLLVQDPPGVTRRRAGGYHLRADRAAEIGVPTEWTDRPGWNTDRAHVTRILESAAARQQQAERVAQEAGATDVEQIRALMEQERREHAEKMRRIAQDAHTWGVRHGYATQVAQFLGKHQLTAEPVEPPVTEGSFEVVMRFRVNGTLQEPLEEGVEMSDFARNSVQVDTSYDYTGDEGENAVVSVNLDSDWASSSWTHVETTVTPIGD